MPEDLCTCGHPRDEHVDLVFGCKVMAPYGDLDDVCCRCSRFAPGQNPADEVRRLRARVADREHELIRAGAERAAMTSEREQIIEALGGLAEGESIPDAIRFMRVEWEHYSREMSHAGYETIPRLTAERDEARAERDAALAALASIEWQPRRTLAGTEALFCPACGRPKSEPEHLRALNRQHGGIRDDGHRRDCPLASALAETRVRTP